MHLELLRHRLRFLWFLRRPPHRDRTGIGARRWRQIAGLGIRESVREARVWGLGAGRRKSPPLRGGLEFSGFGSFDDDDELLRQGSKFIHSNASQARPSWAHASGPMFKPNPPVRTTSVSFYQKQKKKVHFISLTLLKSESHLLRMRNRIFMLFYILSSKPFNFTLYVGLRAGLTNMTLS
jgi:hypothetical protein